MCQPITYLIYATPRSGSYLLCEALSSTRLAGYPTEYFAEHNKVRIWRQRNISNYVEYLNELIVDYATPNGVFGAKITWQQFQNFTRLLLDIEGNEVSLPDLMSQYFPNLHYIWIKRQDKIRQAISYWRALQTGVWSVTSNTVHVPADEPVFDFGAIRELLRRIIQDETEIQKYFLKINAKPFVIIYEEFTDTYEETAIQTLEYLNIPKPENLVFSQRRLIKQSDSLSEEWLQKYYNFKQE